MVRLPDPVRSRALLIGTAKYPAGQAAGGFPDVPAVTGNLASLGTLLCDPSRGGFSPAHCTVVPDPETPRDVQEAILEACGVASDVLLVYYAGHGHRPQGRDLFLTCSTSMPDTVETTGVYYPFLLGWLQQSQAAVTILVLDCCFSGKAAQDLAPGSRSLGRASAPAELLERREVEIDGVCVLASSGPTQVSGADDGTGGHTLFTGHLVTALRDGLPDEGRLLRIRALYEHTRRAMAAAGSAPQLPLLGATGTADALALAVNPAFREEQDGEDPAGRDGGVSLTELMRAQVRAARELPYRIFGSRAQLLPDVYVPQELRELLAESEAEDRDELETANAENLAGNRPEDASRNRTEDLSEDRHLRPGGRRPLAELLDGGRHRVVVAGPGAGKSTMTLHLTASLAHRWLKRERDREPGAGSSIRPALLPLRVSARRLSAHLDSDRQTALAAALTAELGSHLRDRIAPALLADPPPGIRWLLLVDGLDEITAPDARARLLEVLHGFTDTTTATAREEADDGPPFRLLMTTRPLNGSAWSRILQFTDTDRYTLEPFDQKALAGFAHAWFTHDGRSRAEEFLRRLAEARLAELAQVPLLATIAAVMVEQNPNQALPTNRFALYEAFIAQLLTRGDMEGPSHQQSSPGLAGQLRGRRIELLENLAVAHLRGITELTAFLRDHAPPPDNYELPPGAWHQVLTATLADTGLMTESAGELRFLHQSFAEHLAARVQARGLPQHYTPRDRRWKETVHWATPRAYSQEAAAAEIRLVLEHHTHRHPDNGLIHALQRSRSADHHLLAGQILASGVVAAPEQTTAFLTELGGWCEQALRSRRSDPYRRMRAGLAVLPTTPHRDRVTAWLRSTISADTLSPDVRRMAARQLGAMGPEYEGEAAEALIAFAATANEGPSMAPRTWQDLADLGPDGRRRAIRLAEETWASHHEPRALAFLARLGPEHHPRILATLHQETARYTDRAHDRDRSTRPNFVDRFDAVIEALGHQSIPLLRELTDQEPPGYHRDKTVSMLVRLSPGLAPAQQVALLKPFTADRKTGKNLRVTLIKALVSQGDMAAELLLDLLADSTEDASVRLAALDVTATGPCLADVLLAIATEPVPDNEKQPRATEVARATRAGRGTRRKRRTPQKPDPKELLRTRAARRLIDTADATVADRLVTLAECGNVPPGTRVMAAQVLAPVGTDEQRQRALTVLWQIGADPDTSLSLRWQVADGLLHADPGHREQALDIMIAALPDIDGYSPMTYVERLEELGLARDPRVVRALVGWIDEPRRGASALNNYWRRRDAATEALARSGPEERAALVEAWTALLRTSKSYFLSPRDTIRLLAEHDPDLAEAFTLGILREEEMSYNARLDAATELCWRNTAHAPEAVAITLALAAKGPTSQRRSAAHTVGLLYGYGFALRRQLRSLLPPKEVRKLPPASRRRARHDFARLRAAQTARALGWLAFLAATAYGLYLFLW